MKTIAKLFTWVVASIAFGLWMQNWYAGMFMWTLLFFWNEYQNKKII